MNNVLLVKYFCLKILSCYDGETKLLHFHLNFTWLCVCSNDEEEKAKSKKVWFASDPWEFLLLSLNTSEQKNRLKQPFFETCYKSFHVLSRCCCCWDRKNHVVYKIENIGSLYRVALIHFARWKKSTKFYISAAFVPRENNNTFKAKKKISEIININNYYYMWWRGIFRRPNFTPVLLFDSVNLVYGEMATTGNKSAVTCAPVVGEQKKNHITEQWLRSRICFRRERKEGDRSSERKLAHSRTV